MIIMGVLIYIAIILQRAFRDTSQAKETYYTGKETYYMRNRYLLTHTDVAF